MPALTLLLSPLFAAVLGVEPPAAGKPSPTPPSSAEAESSETVEVKPARPEDKTLVAALDVEQGEGKDRVSLYRDGTLVLVKTYLGVRTVKKKLLSEEEVELIRKVCSESLALDTGEFRADLLGRGVPRVMRIEIGRTGELPRVFVFDEMARVPLVLGRARGALEELLARFDESVVSQDSLWDPTALKTGDLLTNRSDGKRYRIVRDDAFVRSLEMLEEERTLQRLVILREDVPKLFHPPGSDGRAKREP